MSMFTLDIYTIWIEVYILISTSVLILFGVLFSTNNTKGYPILINVFNFWVIQITLNSLYLLFTQVVIITKSWQNMIFIDYMTYNIQILIIITFLIYCLIVKTYNKYQYLIQFELWILMLLSLISFCFIIKTNDLLLVYLAIEFQSLIFYILASFNRTSEFSTEAGIKYFILGAFSSALLLFGISIIYGLTGITNLTDFSNLFLNVSLTELSINNGILISLIFIITALLFKLSAAPFHMWSPDVYEGSPTSITAFFSILPKLTIISLLIKLLILTFYDFILIWRKLLLLSILMSSIIGTLGALKQIKWKRFIAYSSISHISFLLLALYTGDTYGTISLLLYICVYILMLLTLFILILNIQIIKYPHKLQMRYFDYIKNIAHLNPFLSVSFTLILFSMAGIPPLVGFFIKFVVLLTAIKSNLYSTVIILILMNCIACFYYLRLIKIIYFDTTLIFNVINPINKLNSILIGIALIIIALSFIDFELVLILINVITKQFFI